MLPNKITVMGEKIAVKQSLKLLEQFETASDEVLGLALILEDTIIIRKDIPEKSKPRVLVHEAAHHAMHKNGIDQYLSREQQEVLCQMISGLYFELKRCGV